MKFHTNKILIGTILQKLYLFCESVASLHITISPLDDLCVNICFSVMLRSHEPRTRRNWVQRCTRWSLTTVWHKARLLHFLRSLVSQVFQVFCSRWWGECQGGNESLFKGKRHVPSFSSARKLATTPLGENTSFHIWGFRQSWKSGIFTWPFFKKRSIDLFPKYLKNKPFCLVSCKLCLFLDCHRTWEHLSHNTVVSPSWWNEKWWPVLASAPWLWLASRRYCVHHPAE